MAQTRRQFLVNTGCGALSASALLSGLGRFALIDALASSDTTAGYTALVCLFLFGGNDSNNVVIPYTDYADYDSARAGATFYVPQADLLQISPPSTPGSVFGFHPRFSDAYSPDGGTTFNHSLKNLWDMGKMAVVCNTGPLIRPVSRPDYRSGLYHPYQLFSHSDQQTLWQTAYANRPKQTGWGGSAADKTGGSGSSFPAISSMAGVTIFSTGQNTRPLVLAPAPTPLNATLKLFKYGNNPPEQAIFDALAYDGADPMPALIQGAAKITKTALDASAALTGDSNITTGFPNTGIGNQLLQVAKLIKLSMAPPISVSKQIFFVSMGGFDTHTGQGAFDGNAGQVALLRQLSQAIGSFYDATVELGIANQVTLFTSSDFSRTFIPGGGLTGTDHAWGSHQFVVGGAVKGGDFYGQYPSLKVGDAGVQDTDGGSGARGRWIPTTSVEQYAATLADWYGLAASDRTVVFPNIGNFDSPILGFMGGGAGINSAPRPTGILSRG